MSSSSSSRMLTLLSLINTTFDFKWAERNEGRLSLPLSLSLLPGRLLNIILIYQFCLIVNNYTVPIVIQ